MPGLPPPCGHRKATNWLPKSSRCPRVSPRGASRRPPTRTQRPAGPPPRSPAGNPPEAGRRARPPGPPRRPGLRQEGR
eukprot:12464806-Alexandrium_andersonii.AAC.1